MTSICRNRPPRWVFVPLLPLLFLSVSYALAEEKWQHFRQDIPAVAEKFIGVPYSFGKGFKESGAVDNSHLFCLIYHEAAARAGLEFQGYMPMKDILENTVRVEREDLKNGDLIVLENDHAAMVYEVESPGMFHMIYSSEKRQQVISFNSRNVAYDAYWFPNLKGFFRLAEGMFLPSP